MIVRKRMIWIIITAVMLCLIVFGAVVIREHTYWLNETIAEEFSDAENTEASIVQWIT